MGNDNQKHREEDYVGTEQPRSFPELVEELLEMQRENYAGDAFKNSDALGKDEVRGAFYSEPRFEDNPEQLRLITDFAKRKMELDGTPPTEVLSNILNGEYDKEIASSAIKRREQADIIALYGLLNTFRGTREDISKVLGQFLVRFDNPRTDLHEHLSGVDWKGLEAVPGLVDLCRTAIEKFGLDESSIRISFMEASVARKRSGEEDNEYAATNLGSVLRDNHEAKPSKISTKRLKGSANPDDSDSDSGKWSQVS